MAALQANRNADRKPAASKFLTTMRKRLPTGVRVRDDSPSLSLLSTNVGPKLPTA